MCVFGGGGGQKDERLDGLSDEFKAFIEARGGLDAAFNGSVAAARSEFQAAGVPGPPSAGPTFFGARLEEDRIGVGDLKIFGGINLDGASRDNRPSSLPDPDTTPRPTPPPIEIPRFPRIPRQPRRPRSPNLPGRGDEDGGRADDNRRRRGDLPVRPRIPEII